jgi:hypothetical protein
VHLLLDKCWHAGILIVMKKYKKTYYFDEDTYKILEQLYAIYITLGEKKSLSEIISEAIRLYHTELKRRENNHGN